MRTRFLRGVLVLALATVAAAASADETTFCNAVITTLPYTISTQGHYCFDRNLSFAATSGAAITIASDFVVLDLNNFKLGGGSAGLATLAVGIQATNHSNITVRNGNIRGFATGIKLYGTTITSALNNLVENNTLDGNTVKGIWVHGTGNTVRNNIVTNTGGSTAAAHPFFGWTVPIDVAYTENGTPDGGAATVAANTVYGSNPPAAGGDFFGIVGVGGTTVIDNIVTITTAGGFQRVFGTICKDNIVYQTSGTAYSCPSLVGTTNFP